MHIIKGRQGLRAEEYAPLPGFFDLRDFELSEADFLKAWGVQMYLRSAQAGKGRIKRKNPAVWKQAQIASGQLQTFLLPRLRPDALI